jgi:hypothetical protein
MGKLVSLEDIDLSAAREEMITVLYHLGILRERIEGTEIEKYVVKEIAALEKIMDFYFQRGD